MDENEELMGDGDMDGEEGEESDDGAPAVTFRYEEEDYGKKAAKSGQNQGARNEEDQMQDDY